MTEQWIPDLGGLTHEERKAVWGGAGEAREDPAPKKKEGRMVAAQVEVRAEGGTKQIVGYGAVFNVETIIAG